MKNLYSIAIVISLIFLNIPSFGGNLEHSKGFLHKRQLVKDFLKTFDWNRGQDPPDLSVSLEVYNPRDEILTTIIFGTGSIDGFFGVLVTCDTHDELARTSLKIDKGDFPAFVQVLKESRISELPENDPYLYIIDSNKCVIRIHEGGKESEVARHGLFDVKKFKGTTASEYLKTGTIEERARFERFIRTDEENRLVVLCTIMLAIADRLDLLYEYSAVRD